MQHTLERLDTLEKKYIEVYRSPSISLSEQDPYFQLPPQHLISIMLRPISRKIKAITGRKSLLSRW
jgi:hypothetical protein